MGVEVKVTRSWSLEHLELVTEEDMRQIGLLAREQIVRRTGMGIDVNGQPFQDYSPAYADAKHKAIGGGHGRPNLQVSGGMLNDLTIVDVKVEPDKASVTLGWTK